MGLSSARHVQRNQLLVQIVIASQKSELLHKASIMSFFLITMRVYRYSYFPIEGWIILTNLIVIAFIRFPHAAIGQTYSHKGIPRFNMA